MSNILKKPENLIASVVLDSIAASAGDISFADGVISIVGLPVGIQTKDIILSESFKTAYSAGTLGVYDVQLTGVVPVIDQVYAISVQIGDGLNAERTIRVTSTSTSAATLATQFVTAIMATPSRARLFTAAVSASTKVRITEVSVDTKGLGINIIPYGATKTTTTPHVDSSGTNAEVKQYDSAAAYSDYSKYTITLKTDQYHAAEIGGNVTNHKPIIVWAHEAESDFSAFDTEMQSILSNESSTDSEDFSGSISVDTINEHTTAAGVTVDSVVLKDGGITTVIPNAYANATGITAFATGGQASATALTKEINNVTTCATAGDSVKLMPAAAGLTQIVKNSGAAALDIFPAASDSIDALAINLAIRIQPGSIAIFRAKDAIVWESNVDETFTLLSPTTNTGALVLKATASGGNFTTTITNASQAAARVYTIPDAGASASFVQTEGAQTINGAKTFGTAVTVPNGVVGTPGIKTTTTGHGMYEISSTQLGFSVAGALYAALSTTAGWLTGKISELVTGAGITLGHNIIRQKSLTALNSTGTITAAIVNKGGITSTSAAAVVATLDTATAIGTQIGAVNGTSIEFLVDNTAGANTVTVAVAAGITVCSGVVTGSDTLTVSTANAIGVFRLVFSSATVAKLYRVG